MVSQIGWIDFSSFDRDRVKQVLSQLQIPGTLDELGIGALRDGFSDFLFPGFSTIQTRAKYLITVPRILRDFDKDKHKSLEKYLKLQENRVAEALVKNHGNSDEVGIIGATRINTGGVDRRPSSVYWNAFRVWKIIETPQSLAQFCRNYGSPEMVESLSDEFEEDHKDAHSKKQIIHLDKNNHEIGWLDKVSLKLTKSEAEFLADKIRRGPSNSIPSQLLQHGLLQEALEDKYKSFSSFAEWMCQQSIVCEETKYYLRMANEFSEAMYGAHIRYNFLLMESNEKEHMRQDLQEDWESWFSSVIINEASVNTWFTAIEARVRPETYKFVQQWCYSVTNKITLKQLDQMVEAQAKHNKGKRSLLLRRMPKEQGWVGMQRLNYRWERARVILGDIQEGLSC